MSHASNINRFKPYLELLDMVASLVRHQELKLDQETQVGFVEIDLVAHCDDTVSGQYVHSFTATDVATGWTECFSMRHRSQIMVSAALDQLQTRLPFPLLGIDSDNDSVFINELMLKYCQANNITFTRCRPYKKNDQCFVEQKN